MQDDASSIENLRKKLYVRAGGPAERGRRTLRDVSYDVASSWTHEDDAEAAVQQSEMQQQVRMGEAFTGSDLSRTPPTVPAIMRDVRLTEGATRDRARRRTAHRFIWTLFLASFAFFVVSAGVAAYFFFLKGPVSCKNVDIEISGPVAVPAGEELALQINVVNTNTTAMELTDLIVDYPEGTRSPIDMAIDLPIMREDLGTIEPGARTRTIARSVLFGKEKTQADINVRVEYRIKESNAIFTCESPYKVVISSSPLTVTVDAVNEISSGQELVLTVKVSSNAQNVLKTMLLRAQYPFGFEFIEATPKPAHGENVWALGDLMPGTERTITVRGRVLGQVTEDRVFRFEAGGQSAEHPEEIVKAFETIEHPISIATPFLGLTLSIDGDEGTGDASVNTGKPVEGIITWKNQLPYPLYDVEVTAKIEGAMLRPETVSPASGYWRSLDNTILWTPQTNADFQRIDPGEVGTLRFSFSTQQLAADTSARNPMLNIGLSTKGRRIFEDEGTTPETMESFAQRTIKLVSDLQLAPRVVYSVGPFTNTGPYPPRVEQETTYTVIWQVANTTNDVVDAVLTAQLPVYVNWLGQVDPSDAAIVYNPTTRVITWKVGDVPAGTGFRTAAREVAFQVSFIPSVTQAGRDADLVQNLFLKGVDRFTGRMLETERDNLTTNISTDPNLPTRDRGRIGN